ncbi:rhamnogalacturonan acetylesterase [Hymenobacter taeanensis]|uniref:Rhamnogalacturonan acetylesterase n=1 Tax=Hymenobacter taeanensis TaxID=2735321 RepID=A0A6M6BIP0_9BACT|nr:MULTISPECIES: rhamnogalacturonan acetylesterase [Hymenobacter]QJX47997.1 rhamnogalacturonan acetylesterase [Hymenobacter taeanensis]UOQ82555.1 rhamnogalacturonan acetylesterase [Hymenobacter sp. 5414T-23]
MVVRLLSKKIWGLGLVAILALLAFTTDSPTPIKVYLVGDSTMADKQEKAFPETGWGTPFKHFFDETVTVDNRAQNGRSTKTFLTENRWQPVAAALRPGDYVLIQFGHNDEVPTKRSYTPEADFRANLVRFVTETRAKKATPVLITPVARRKFDAAGKVEGTHTVYVGIVRDVAKQQQVPLINLDTESQAVLQQFGVENSRLLFNQLAPGEHPNYPDGRDDNTHFNELGARKMAQLVLADIRRLKLELADRIVKREVKTTVDPQAR